MQTPQLQHVTLGSEPLEDRRMLATMADIVFLVDESGFGVESQLGRTGWRSSAHPPCQFG
ncbi:MAG: hypothetical protein CMJ58_23195 [Planctomycetaceae bacterium]|nr:hypothetical protein [Planctomycetaceae bacterium]